MVLDQYLWSDQDHINTRQLWEYLASYLYLPRLKDQDVLLETIDAGIGELFAEHFAYAGRFNEETGRYEGLIVGGGGRAVIDDYSVLAKPDVAKAQLAKDEEARGSEERSPDAPTGYDEAGTGATDLRDNPNDLARPVVRRFYGSVELDADRAPRDMGKIAEEVLQHLTTLPRADVKVTVEIAADVPDGVSDEIQRIVTENCQTLGFKAHGFEEGSS